jgi:hypothetical protein
LIELAALKLRSGFRNKCANETAKFSIQKRRQNKEIPASNAQAFFSSLFRS